MSKSFFYFLLTLTLATSLTACSKTENTNSNSSANNPTSTASPSATPGSENSTPSVSLPNNAPLNIPVNISVENAKLPTDIPVFPNSKSIDKRQTNRIINFMFSTDSSTKDVETFYRDSMKKEGWALRLEQQNVADGLYYVKPRRSVRVVSYKDGALNKTVFRLTVSELPKDEDSTMDIMGEDGKVVKRVTAANLNDVGRMPKDFISKCPIYPNATKKLSENPGVWWEYRSKDPVKKIADWYSKELQTINWSLEQDNSELGDSMMIYSKKDEEGRTLHMAVRINDMKDKGERWITLINYPYNSMIPDLDPLSKVQQEQPEAAKLAKELAKKNQAKAPKSPEKVSDLSEAELKAKREAGRLETQERVKKMMEERAKAKNSAAKQ